MENIRVICLVTLLMAIGAALSKPLKREKRAWIIESFSIEEEYPGPYPYLLGTIMLENSYWMKFRLTGSGVDKDPVGVLSIDSKTGNILLHKKIDYEHFSILKLTFEAINISTKITDTRLGVEINILDINDNDPKFQKDIYRATVEESRQQGQTVTTVVAIDYDKKDSPNSTVDYRIMSVTPNTPNVQFYIENDGKISFKGCLDYEKAKMYTIMVEAKDRGEVQRRSSSCTVIVNIEDNNNNMPIFTGHTGPGRVKERETEKSILRLQVTDKDLRKTAAWRARYMLHGEGMKNFQVDTDPETNEGIISVIQPLDFEEGLQRNLSISVENEAPFFSCKVKERAQQGLWTVTYSNSSLEKGLVSQSQTKKITIVVEDVNDPPEFLIPRKHMTVDENIQIGFLLETFNAKDHDLHFASDFVFRKGEDPAGWVNVDSKTCEIRTTKLLDRESTFVVNGTYTVIVHAIDKGVPPMTGTATLIVHLRDQNDNTPQLTTNKLEMCLTESGVNITAFDLDDYPYAAPFRFELLDGAEEWWMVEPNLGSTVRLVTKTTIYAGHHNLQLKISDMQGLSSQQEVTVTVCSCSFQPSCHAQRSSSSRAGDRAIGVIFGILLFLGLLLLVFFLSCGKVNKHLWVDQDSEDFLMKSNTEAPGTDCKVPDVHQVTLKPKQIYQTAYTKNGVFKDISPSQKAATQYHSLNKHYKRIQLVEAPDKELCDYTPRVYADEGPLPTDPGVDAISISEESFNPDMLLQLGPKFIGLAAVCRPELVFLSPSAPH